ncbi:type II secretion system protein GspE [Chimaeribacter californicus]|uniref:Type II secretion system protein GspE n=1 Tax=Chimaeribacter californicus TaxID=2060067 RepID=A0A2N5EEQ5_9GAMM|nr:type II secretion system protein GspE [Chimaeribacter californicus]PLR41015.1 type II secretion system protein GspE [Chimaeribacter californicus]
MTVTTEHTAALRQICARFQAVIIHHDAQHLHVAAQAEVLEALSEALRFACPQTLHTECWPAARLEQARQAAPQAAAEPPPASLRSQADAAPADDNAPAALFIREMLLLALQRRASDIHLEPYAGRYRLRLRIDGVLQEITPPPAGLGNQIGARLKVMGKLDIAERRLPQDGQCTVQCGGQPLALRLSSLPTLYGEKLVLRLQQGPQQAPDMAQLGMTPEALACFRRVLAQPQGLILVTGPTGSGKTVTLYSGLKQLNSPAHNLCSVEDPVEIPVEGINQTQVNPKAELSFARILRALLRQDPDIIMIGEIRDAETAEIAVNAAQTGHLVLSTLHTNSTTETLVRLNQMGIEGYLIASCLKLVIAQRLVRRLCPHCRTRSPEAATLPPGSPGGPLFPWRAAGCHHCCAGYYGRTGLYEMLVVTPEIQQALTRQATVQELAAIARHQGQASLLHVGLALAAEGTTSLEEVYRVVGAQDG